MPDYQLGKIYKIICNITGEVYYGSTTLKYLCNRKSTHIADVKRTDEGKRAGKCMSYDIIKRGNWDIVLVEQYPCESKDELHTRESFYIKNNVCINKVDPAKWDEEKNKKSNRQSYLRNKEKILQKQKESRDNRTEEEIKKDKEYQHNYYLAKKNM